MPGPSSATVRQHLAAGAARRDPDRAAAVGDRVVDQVLDHVIEAVAVAEDGELGGDVDGDRRLGELARHRGGAGGRRRVADQRREHDRDALGGGEHGGVEALELEEVVDQPGDPRRVAVDRREELLRRGVVDAAAEQGLGVAGDRGHRGAQLVGGAGQELAADPLRGGELRDAHLQLAGELGERVRQQRELVAGLLRVRGRHVVVAAGEPLGGAGHRLERPGHRANRVEAEEDRGAEADADRDDHPPAQQAPPRLHARQRHRDPDRAAALGLDRHHVHGRPVRDQLPLGAAEPAVARVGDLGRRADRMADVVLVRGVTDHGAVGADDRDPRGDHPGEARRQGVGAAAGLEPARDLAGLTDQAGVELADHRVADRAIEHAHRDPAEHHHQREVPGEQPGAQRKPHAESARAR